MTKRSNSEFDAAFRALTGNAPFPWQRSLFERLIAGEFPDSCDIPTGLGKTSIIAIWLLALAHCTTHDAKRKFPRRLVYIVNRRTVVDQATRETELMRKNLKDEVELKEVRSALRSLGVRDIRGLLHLDFPLAISTLRGQFADNAEWNADPTRAAIVVGTVDMIGSRLLFSGYGRGFKARPLHAAFLAQDTLLVHDEAHLEPAFQELITAIKSEQRRVEGELRDGFGPLHVIALTATSRTVQSATSAPFRLGADDRAHELVRQRIQAKKRIAFHPIAEAKNVADKITELALAHKDSGQAILVFVREVKSLKSVMKKLPSESCLSLTGTMRGRERDLLKTHSIFARFDPKPEAETQEGTVYIVSTSAGEVGVDISADHLVCDLTPFDSMAQRFGRVNRFGKGDATIDIVYQGAADPGNEAASAKKKSKAKDGYDAACERTRALLLKLPQADSRHDASPDALSRLDEEERRDAFTPAPAILPVNDVLFDAWSLTSIRDKLPGRPPVADWLHGVPQDWEPPQTGVAWRNEVEWLSKELRETYDPQDLIDDYPLKPHELLHDRRERVFEELEKIVGRHPDVEIDAWLVDAEGRVTVEPLSKIVTSVEQGRLDLADCTVLLPPRVGGLKKGLLNGEELFREEYHYDVADEWFEEVKEETKEKELQPRRCRLVGEVEQDDDKARRRRRGMRLLCTIRLGDSDSVDDDSQVEKRDDGSVKPPDVWRWYVKPQFADDDGSRMAVQPQTLPFHLAGAEHFAREIVARLGLKDPEASAITWAARFHDLGKNRALWQRSIGNRDPNQVLAKSGRKKPFARETTRYRHELGSLFDVEKEDEFNRLSVESKELARHLIATHHGRARPHFPADEVFDPNHADRDAVAIAREVPRRFARLQRKYGRWGLAYLESLVRVADALASQLPESADDSDQSVIE